MNYKLVAIDMDGTLLNDQHKISDKNKEVIYKLANRGVNFILASGRSYQSLHPYTKELDVYLPLITANGALIKSSLDDKVYYKCDISLDKAQEIIDYGIEHDYSLSLYYEDEIKTIGKRLREQILELEGIKSEVLGKNINLNREPIKIIYSSDPERIKKAEEFLINKYRDDLYITRSNDIYLEIMDLDVSKGNALNYMIEKMNISAQEVIAIGNNFNDIAMFDVAGLAVAMENAPQKVKEKSDYVTKDNNQDGVAVLLEDIFSIR